MFIFIKRISNKKIDKIPEIGIGLVISTYLKSILGYQNISELFHQCISSLDIMLKWYKFDWKWSVYFLDQTWELDHETLINRYIVIPDIMGKQGVISLVMHQYDELILTYWQLILIWYCIYNYWFFSIEMSISQTLLVSKQKAF